MLATSRSWTLAETMVVRRYPAGCKLFWRGSGQCSRMRCASPPLFLSYHWFLGALVGPLRRRLGLRAANRITLPRFLDCRISLGIRIVLICLNPTKLPKLYVEGSIPFACSNFLSRKACHPEKIEFFGFVLPNCRSFSRTPGPPL